MTMALRLILSSNSSLIQTPMLRLVNRSALNQVASRGGNFSSLSGAPGTIAAAADGRLRPHPHGLSHRWPDNNNGSSISPGTAYISSNFSTAAMPQKAAPDPEPSPATNPTRTKRKPMRKRNPLIVTPTAAARIQFLISQHNETGNHGVGIRLGTKKRGCNGLSYTLNYAFENHLDEFARDEAMTISLPSPDMPGDGLKVFVDPMALMSVIGTTMDFVDDEMSSEFTFTNPNSKGECGCGESFNV